MGIEPTTTTLATWYSTTELHPLGRPDFHRLNLSVAVNLQIKSSTAKSIAQLLKDQAS